MPHQGARAERREFTRIAGRLECVLSAPFGELSHSSRAQPHLPHSGTTPLPSNLQPSNSQDSRPLRSDVCFSFGGKITVPDFQDFILPRVRTSIPLFLGSSPPPEGTSPSRSPWPGRGALCSAVRALTGGSCGCVTGSWLPGNPRRLITAATVINQK